MPPSRLRLPEERDFLLNHTCNRSSTMHRSLTRFSVTSQGLYWQRLPKDQGYQILPTLQHILQLSWIIQSLIVLLVVFWIIQSFAAEVSKRNKASWTIQCLLSLSRFTETSRFLIGQGFFTHLRFTGLCNVSWISKVIKKLLSIQGFL
jgi:hypothetical protein